MSKRKWICVCACSSVECLKNILERRRLNDNVDMLNIEQLQLDILYRNHLNLNIKIKPLKFVSLFRIQFAAPTDAILTLHVFHHINAVLFYVLSS